jgi:hypothetical protein
MTTLHFQGPGFSLQVPSDWFNTAAPQIQAMFIAPPRQGVRANLMITLRPLDEAVTLEEVVRSSLETQKKEYAEFELLEDSEYKHEDLIGHQHYYKWFSKEHNARIVQRQVMFVRDRILTTITTTRTDFPGVEDLDNTFDTMINSFMFQ